MGNKGNRRPNEKLRLLVQTQVFSYIFLIIWILVIDIGSNVGSEPNGSPLIWVPFGALGILLIHSALVFIRGGKWAQVESLRTARIAQLILFVFVFAATFPAFIVASMFLLTYLAREHSGIFIVLLAPEYFIACILGIIAIPIIWRITRSLVSKKIKVPVEEKPKLD